MSAVIETGAGRGFPDWNSPGFPSFHPYNSTAISLVTNADLSGKKYKFTLLEGKSITCNVPVP